MAIKTYQGEPASHTHENRMLDSFIEAVRPRWEQSEDSLVLVSNAYWNQAAIDLVCILDTALVVIDFKAYRGRMSISENGPWLNGNIRVAGGSKPNPLIQIKHNKFSLISWLKDRGLLSHCNLGHISGAVVFDGPIEIEGNLPASVSQWFSTIAIGDAAAHLDRLASPQISISDRDRDRIIEALSIPEYRWAAHQIVDTETGDSDKQSDFSPTASQKKALEAIERFVADPSSSVLSVSGMTSTGKSSLIPQLSHLKLGGRSLVILAPNNRFAGALASRQGLKASGIYHHIYDTNAPPQKVGGDTDKIDEIPLRGDNADPEDCIYVIDDAHLITDTYFEPEPGKRFGSGRLVADLLKHARLKATQRKLIVLSDPYHVTHAKDPDLLPSPELWERNDLTGQIFKLSQLIRDDEAGAIIDNALTLVRHIENDSFAAFDFISGNGLALESGRIAADDAAEFLRSSPSDILLIAHSNAEVTKLNDWARRERFGTPARPHAVPGDLLEMHSFVRNDDPLEDGGVDFSPGDLVDIESAGEVRQVRQPLSGRDEPVEFRVQEVRTSGTSFILLVDFLLAESKEIATDVQIASQVWSKAQRIKEPIKARFGYAATAHHARALRKLRTVVSPPKSVGRHNEAYFRWLYTAITRATHACVVANWKPLNVFDEATFNGSSASYKLSIPTGAGIAFDPERPLTTDEEDWVVPEGIPAEPRALKETVAIWITLQPLLDTLGFRILRIRHHPYQVHFMLSGAEESTCELKVSYKGNHTFSSVRADDPKIQLQICEGLTSRVQLDADQRRIVKALPKLPNLEELRILSLKSSNYRIQIVVGNSADGLAELELNHTGEGMVSSIRLLHYTSETIRDLLAHAFQNEDGG